MFRWLRAISILIEFFLILNISSCTADYPAIDTTPNSKSGCGCSTSSTPVSATPVSATSTPVSSTTSLPTFSTDTTHLKAPRILPNGGSFHVSVEVKLVADILPQGAIIEYSLDKGQTWKAGQQLMLISGGQLMARVRSDNKVSVSQAASFRLYFERMLIIGNSIMSHPPSPDLGWYNFNGMAASAPEKDFVHLLSANMETLHKPLLVRLLNGGDFEQKFGAVGYDMAEFAPVIRDFKPDLIVVRLGENMDEGRVEPYDLEGQFRALLGNLSTGNDPLKIVCTTSVWYRPKSDAIIRKVTLEKGFSLVDLSCMVGQGQYLASQYTHPGVAAHPNDTGMQRIADLIWEKIQ